MVGTNIYARLRLSVRKMLSFPPRWPERGLIEVGSKDFSDPILAQ